MRRVKRRSGARVLLVAGGDVLLLRDSDPGVPEFSWWVSPGGGLESDEEPVAGACRELAEETGLDLLPDRLRLVGRGTAVHGYSDRILIQDEVFFRAEVARFTPSTAGWTASEQQRLKGFSWCSTTPLPEGVWPQRLAELLEAVAPVDLGCYEASSVPLSSVEWGLTGCG